MADRRELNQLSQDRTREKIRLTSLINVLHAYIFEEEIMIGGKMQVPKFDPTKLNAIKLLMGKGLPDLKTQELVVQVEEKMKVVSAVPISEQAWVEANKTNIVSIMPVVKQEIEQSE